jgi:predicted RNase H-like nuclease (RuvC/YqgF family)
MGEIVDKHERRIGELEDELKKAKRRIEELKAELADGEMREHVDGECEIRKQRRDAFDMVQNDKGEWG